jgi:hypothetical protein
MLLAVLSAGPYDCDHGRYEAVRSNAMEKHPLK